MIPFLRTSFGIILILSLACSQARGQGPTPQQQIRAAVSAAPKQMRPGARVLGFNESGALVTLRKGSNNLVCLADDPSDQRFHVSCYAASMEPFMKRGRELRAQGLNHSQVDSVRKAEINSGQLEYPRHPAALYSLSGPGDGFDYTKGSIREASRLYVLYVPFQSEKTTALTETPIGKGAPWLMEPGLPWAHVMISGEKINNRKE